MFKRIFILLAVTVLCVGHLFGQNRIGDWQTHTNMMSVRAIQVIGGQVYAATNGGLLLFNKNTQSFTKVTNIDGLTHTDLTDMLLDANNQLWLATGAPRGEVNIWDPGKGISKVIPLDQAATVSINHLTQDGGNIFGAATRNIENVVVHYNRQDDGGFEYKDFYNQFPVNPGHINDITVFQDKIYLATDVGLIATKEEYNAVPPPNLKAGSSWMPIPGTASLGVIESFATNKDTLYFSSSSTVWRFSGGTITELPFNLSTSTVYSIKFMQDTLYAGARYGVFRYQAGGWHRVLAEQVPVTAMTLDTQNTLWLGTQRYGIVRVDSETDSLEFWQPNGPFDNEFSAMEFTPDGRLVAANDQGIAILEDGLWTNILNYARDSDRRFIDHLIRDDGGDWSADTIFYRAARPYDVVVRGEDDVFVSHEGQGMLQVDLSDIHQYQVYDTTGGHLSGSEGIGSGSANYIITRDITLDNNNTLWIANAFAANGNVLSALTPDGEWMHFNISNPQIQGKLNLLPTEIAVDNQNRIWVGSQKKDVDPQTQGGIALLDFGDDLFNEADDRWIWLNQSNGLKGMTIYSISITSNNVAYVVTSGEKRLQKYNIPTELPANPNDIYFSTDRIDELVGVFPLIESEPDIRDNIWFISADNGIKMRTARGELLNDAQGYNVENSHLLSDNVYAIVSNPQNGITYFATDFGISSVTTPYADPRKNFSEIYTYPSPYYIPNRDAMVIAQLPDETEVKVLTVTGQVVKTLSPNDGTVKNRQAFWDGTNENGDLVGSGVYFLYCYTQDGDVKTTKALVIRQ